MNIVLTGATGFLGSHLLRALLDAGHCVTAVKRSTSQLHRVHDLAARCQWIDADVGNLSAVFAGASVHAVIHCATTYGRKEDSSTVLEGNLGFPLRLLDAAVACHCPYFINTDSFFCKQLPARLEQGQPLYLPTYSLSKYQFRQWGKLYANRGDITFINLQLEHVYGPGDSSGKFIPWLEQQFQDNVPALDLTDGIQIRDFVQVEDVVGVYLRVLEDLPQLSGYESFEVGTGEATPLRRFVEQLRDESGASTLLRFGAIARTPEEIMCSVASQQSPYLIKKG